MGGMWARTKTGDTYDIDPDANPATLNLSVPDQVLVVELQAAWMAIGLDAIGFYTEADAAATFGREEPGTERVYWHVDEIREDPALVVGAIHGMISANHSVETGE